MANYNNLGFTDQEARLICELIVSFVTECPNIAYGHICTEAGESVIRDLVYNEPWDGSYYLSVIERSGQFTAVVDTGHGWLFMIDTDAGEVHHSGGNVCATSKAVMLDAEYFSVDNWLYVNEMASKQ